MYATKDRIGVIVVMDRYRIEGYLHVPAGSRLTDSLNSKAKDFFALTEAKVYRLKDDTLLYSPSYLALNREFIGCLFPMEDA